MSTGCVVALIENDESRDEMVEVVQERFSDETIRYAVTRDVNFEQADLVVDSDINETMQPLGNILQVANFAENEWDDEVVVIYCDDDHEPSFLWAVQCALEESTNNNKFILENGR